MINWRIEGDQAMLATLRVRADRATNVRPFLLAAGVKVRDAAVLRIRSGGPGWAPDAPSTVTMKGSSRPGVDTGTMMSSITVDADAQPGSVTIGIQGPAANRVTTGGVALVNYAYWFQYGTGVYAGHQPWTIVAINAKALHWRAGGREYFARSVFALGQPPRPFLYIDPPLARDIVALAARYFGGGQLELVA